MTTRCAVSITIKLYLWYVHEMISFYYLFLLHFTQTPNLFVEYLHKNDVYKHVKINSSFIGYKGLRPKHMYEYNIHV